MLNKLLQYRPKPLWAYLLEMGVIVFSVSISFLLNEWREGRAERREEQRLIQLIRQDMVADSISLATQQRFLAESMRCTDSLLFALGPGTPPDSLQRYIGYTATYSIFEPQGLAWNSINNLGEIGLLRDDSLRQQLVLLHTYHYHQLQEWGEGDRAYLTENLMPYIDRHFPFSPTPRLFQFDLRERPDVLAQLEADEFRNTVRSLGIFKRGARYQCGIVQAELEKMLALLRKKQGD